MIRATLLLMIVLIMAAPLGACGRKGNPEPPPGAERERVYPSQ